MKILEGLEAVCRFCRANGFELELDAREAGLLRFTLNGSWFTVHLFEICCWPPGEVGSNLASRALNSFDLSKSLHVLETGAA